MIVRNDSGLVLRDLVIRSDDGANEIVLPSISADPNLLDEARWRGGPNPTPRWALSTDGFYWEVADDRSRVWRSQLGSVRRRRQVKPGSNRVDATWHQRPR